MDYYEDWKNEVISFQGNLDRYNPEMAKGSRGTFGLDTSKERFEYEMKIREQLIERGAIKEICHWCKSRNTTHNNGIWKCSDCENEWDPLRLRFRGI